MAELYGFDAYSPREIAARVEAVGVAKARLPLERMLEMAGRTVGQGDVGKPIISDPAKIDPRISGD